MATSRDSRGALSRAQLWLLTTALAITVLDQVVKRVVVRTMELGQSVDVVGSFVRLTRTSNTGGAFGLLRGRGSWFIVVSLTAAVAIAAFSRQIARARRIERVAFALIMGGALGNLLDRVRTGAVVDFIDVGGSAYREVYAIDVFHHQIVIDIIRVKLVKSRYVRVIDLLQNLDLVHDVL